MTRVYCLAHYQYQPLKENARRQINRGLALKARHQYLLAIEVSKALNLRQQLPDQAKFFVGLLFQPTDHQKK